LLVSLLVATASAAASGGGGWVSVDGHRMYYECRGRGSPTVVLDAGSPDTSAVWRYVQPQLAGVTRVCAYDRAGLGRSAPPPPGRRTPLTQVHELYALLAAAKLPGPYVIVGHSWGGLLARLFAWTYPQQTAGAVLVDATTFPYLTPEIARQLPRRTTVEGIDKVAAVVQSAEVKSVGQLPLVVLGSNRPPLAAKLLKAQDAEAALSSDSVDAVAVQSTHYIQFPPPRGQPQLVVKAAEAVVRAVRSQKPLPACQRLFAAPAAACR
jgi:pimeloyl-ACP methyl ester carboxylesterase